ncbi:MAG TPA: hypothetical protein VGL70_13185 [Candidatus Binatia bacterium]|jgi:hypothetical protein
MQVKVDTDIVSTGEERPVRFILGGRSIKIDDIMDRWYSPQGSYYRVLGDDGNFYILKGPAEGELWELVSFTHKDSRGTEPEFEGTKELQ